MSIVFYDPYVTDWNGSEKSLELDDLLRTADVVSIHVIKTKDTENLISKDMFCLLYTSPSPRDKRQSRMPSSA